jgi:hypothetical protein
MTTHATGPLSGLSWLKRGVNLGRHNARAVFGAAAILMFVALLPSIVQLAVLSVLSPDGSGAIVVAAASTVLSIVILSPVIGGYLRLIDAAEHGRPTTALDVFAPFRQGGDAGRLIGFGLLMTLSYVVIAMVLIGLFGDGFLDWYVKVLTLQQASGGKVDPAQMPEMPEGLGGLLGLGSILFLFLSGVYAIGFGQVALGRRPIARAMADGVVGTAKNLLPILLLAIVVVLASIPVGMVLVLVFGVIALMGNLIHPALSMALVVPLYMAMMVVLYVVMFGVMYYLWRDVCAQGDVPEQGPPAGPSNNHQIEL